MGVGYTGWVAGGRGLAWRLAGAARGKWWGVGPGVKKLESPVVGEDHGGGAGGDCCAVLCYAVLYCRALGPTGGVQGDVGGKPVGRQARETQRDGGPGLGAVPAG